MSGCCQAQGSSWAGMSSGDWYYCGGDGKVCGTRNFSGCADSKCGSSSSRGVSPAHLGSPDFETLLTDWGPNPTLCTRPESDAFPRSHVDAQDVSVPSAHALHSPTEKGKESFICQWLFFLFNGQYTCLIDRHLNWISKSYLDSFLEAMAKRIEDPARLL